MPPKNYYMRVNSAARLVQKKLYNSTTAGLSSWNRRDRMSGNALARNGSTGGQARQPSPNKQVVAAARKNCLKEKDQNAVNISNNLAKAKKGNGCGGGPLSCKEFNRGDYYVPHKNSKSKAYLSNGLVEKSALIYFYLLILTYTGPELHTNIKLRQITLF